ncbi:iron-sulfur cluster scaffold-like protein [Altererythrobacter sp. B11]|uniref:iron-sulfur cluster assembly scaffold protein n=1 Tax=Altererythrobacter sp. B11 TaxID=2060312 RepID=UPI000DC6FC78|nr:iron-sulfur cluster assembly scaffold protein [Altererythrobacter sp. B11]BBC73113.1 iron-sulfur cluster scaffold-like protein [Altererythrobacter sp. B11]
MSGAATLYTPELLALAVELAAFPSRAEAAAQGEARSPTCGSTIAMDLALDGEGRIEQPGMRVRACAVGQAAAAIFARHAAGKDRSAIAAAQQAITAWLAGEGPLPDWPDFALLEPARAYPGRHGAILLPWNAALAALSTTPAAR